MRESGQVWLRRARLRVLRLGRRRGAVPSRVGLGPRRSEPLQTSGGHFRSPLLSWIPWSGAHRSRAVSRAMLEGDIGLEAVTPKEAPAAGEYPGAGGGARDPGVAAAASGSFGDRGFPGTEGRAGRRRRRLLSPVAGTSPASFWVGGWTLSASGH